MVYYRQNLFDKQLHGRKTSMSREKALDFLRRHGMDAARIDPLAEAARMAEAMEAGLRTEGAGLPMIPTYLRTDGAMHMGSRAIVVDAGGTNFRAGLIEFTEQGPVLSHLRKMKMPGIGQSATWEEFISFVADAVEPLTPDADDIGFCFSYSAVITPEIDGRVVVIDKEVVITGSEGQLVSASLIAELERRGVTGKRCVILNDTAAVLLGGSAMLDRSRCGGLIGQVSGTGTNTCCVLPLRRIEKLGRAEDTRIIVNLESGMYDGLPRGDFDRALDAESHNHGVKYMEKLTAGVYLGELARLMLAAAAGEGLIAPATGAAIRELGGFDSALLDAWACGERLELCATEECRDFVQTLAQELFTRSARAMCANLTGILLLTGEGKDPERPVVVCAEGSLVQKGRLYRPTLEKLLHDCAGALGRSVRLQVGEETTLPGAAAAALLNR